MTPRPIVPLSSTALIFSAMNGGRLALSKLSKMDLVTAPKPKYDAGVLSARPERIQHISRILIAISFTFNRTVAQPASSAAHSLVRATT